MTELRAFSNLIGGELAPASGGGTLDSVDPATGEAWATIPRSTAPDAEAAVAAARAAFPKWSGLPAAARAHYLGKVAAVFAENAAELAELETRDNGRILSETAKRDLPGMTYLWNQAAAQCTAATEGRSVDFGPRSLGVTRREPYGVTLGIIPWNSPISTLSAKAAYALAAGNTAIIKPAEQATASSLRLGELLAGVLPPGVLNIVSGLGEEVGDPLVRHRGVNKISLTGSVDTAKIITRASADSLKPLALELGGKSPNIVFADADLDKAATGVTTQAIFTANAGQICYGGSRVLIQRPVYDEMLERMKAIAAGIRLGDPMSAETTMGPIVSREQFERVTSYLEIGAKEGAELAFGGRFGAEAVGEGPFSAGYWVEPTLFATSDNALRICQEEIFGPVAVVLPFDTEEEALAIANDSSYGLAAGVWTSSLGTAQRMFRALEAGTVWVNTFRKVMFPLEGYKDSGYGHDSVLAYTREKSGLFEI
ncbi:aldehyde dehydrogenase family protein [Actinomadura parmotrematis]|uniref:Aldehyde dehydrogenase family protein n=1 Tax=Actinomadura parmotrematis TaxID=2864039 RepID=A0ABS7FQY3_9ACTN|nr:aldehyde dehydrogenase family protein [Actinomadura parmotrematis]MBW8482385.1 aldehyde dehydrogenase family protein [Actinomadura parmotrematis]